MNLVDVEVIKVLIKPYQKEDGNWTTTVITGCWGCEKKLTVTDKNRYNIEKYEVGYKWQE